VDGSAGLTDEHRRRGSAYVGLLQESLASLQLLPANHALLGELEEFPTAQKPVISGCPRQTRPALTLRRRLISAATRC
jgi:hypothetical protein